MLHRRPVRRYETMPARSEAMIDLAMADLMACRLTGEATASWCDPAKPTNCILRDETPAETDLLFLLVVP